MTSKTEETVIQVYVKAFQPNMMTMGTADADIDSMEDPSSSTDSEFEEYVTPPAGRNEIQPYRLESTVERIEDSASENVSRDNDSIAENVTQNGDSGAENVSRLENIDGKRVQHNESDYWLVYSLMAQIWLDDSLIPL